MDTQNLNLIKDSFPSVFQHKAEIATRFYDRLFASVPEPRQMFRAEMATQKEMLASVLTTLAKASFDPEKLQDVIARLARSHAGLGITEAQFRAGETALMEALGTVMAPKLPPPALLAWQAAIRRVIAAMIDPPENEPES